MASTGRRSLTRTRVVEEAIALADDEGLAKLSMRALATRLGIEAMSLYHHVPNKDALLDAMVDEVFAETYCPVVGDPWRAELRHRCESAREVLLRHRWAVGLLDSRRSPGPATLAHHDAVLGCLRAAGFSLPLAGHAFAALDAHLYGFLVQEISIPFEGAPPQELVDAIVQSIPEGTLPHFREYTLERALAPGYSFADEFAWGLDLVLDGLEHRFSNEHR